jgi:hypothetical protein
VEVKIGVQYAARELSIESDDTIENVEAQVAAAFADGEGGVLTLVDHKGRKVLVNASKITYVEIGSPTPTQVGFRG